ncbi:PREDICTED: F-box only protein 34 [Acanthisitta chloris]|uniref:F-box only protein 34 n=1 Tax=Acanthisitta chloris TaxID=57068 RepID=UPI0004F0E964|nr:PREDICTED: F-box only protein 34 [Acanthisitta chloris]
MKSSCRAGLHREPLNSTSSTFHQVKRVSGMHLKPYLKLQKKERSPEISQDSLRGHQGSAQGEKYTNCTKLSVFPKPSLVAPSQKLLGIIYPNTMCNMNGKGPADGLSARDKKNTLSATIHQGEEGEGPLDVWAVVKPGNTKEKIAFFAAQQCSSSRLGSMKIKSTWDIDGRTAKRRKKSVDLKKAKIQLERMREANARCSQPEPFACGIEHCSVHYVSESGEGVFPGRSLSVIEMVAFLEQRANALLVDCAKTCTAAPATRLSAQPKGTLPSSDPFSSAAACEAHAERGPCGPGEQQGEPVRVLDMVANDNATLDCTTKERVMFPKQSLHPARKEPLCISISVSKTEKGCRKEKLSNSSSSEDSLPGRLFLLEAEQSAAREQQAPRESTQEKAGGAAQNEDEDALASDRSCVRSSVPTEPSALPVPPPEGALQVLDASCLKRQVSHDFLETRFKIQQLLEPQQYMAFLPHHIIVKIFGLLPTRSLVALKCTCYYFKFIIEYYNIRPADSRWVRDPRYREDPCKQCKKKYVKGDVSLCRWHPKPYCQALPYGPGYWMCCHRSQKGIPGCKLGLHDNHWVPACHSFNRAIHKKTRGAGAEVEEEY